VVGQEGSLGRSVIAIDDRADEDVRLTGHLANAAVGTGERTVHTDDGLCRAGRCEEEGGDRETSIHVGRRRYRTTPRIARTKSACTPTTGGQPRT